LPAPLGPLIHARLMDWKSISTGSKYERNPEMVNFTGIKGTSP